MAAVQQTAVQSKVKSEKILGGTEEERQKFIRSFGWEVAEEPLTVMEVKIPEEFDSVYEEYNNLQKTQGMDLTKYQGKRCKKYQYSVLNYPDRPEHVVCTLLVYDGRVVGGDISGVGEKGYSAFRCLNLAAGAGWVQKIWYNSSIVWMEIPVPTSRENVGI